MLCRIMVIAAMHICASVDDVDRLVVLVTSIIFDGQIFWRRTLKQAFVVRIFSAIGLATATATATAVSFMCFRSCFLCFLVVFFFI